MQHKLKELLLLIGLSIVIGTGCRREEEIISNHPTVAREGVQNSEGKPDSYIVQSWYNLMMKLIIATPGHTPPIVARSFAYTGVALYESLVGEMHLHHSLAGQLNGLTSVPQRQYGNSYAATLTANATLGRIIKDSSANKSLNVPEIMAVLLPMLFSTGHSLMEATRPILIIFPLIILLL